MNTSRLPLLGIVAGALLAVGSLLALSAAGTLSSGANGGNMTGVSITSGVFEVSSAR